MKRVLVLALVAVFLPITVWAGDYSKSESGAVAITESNQSVNFSSPPVPAGLGRDFPMPLNNLFLPMIQYTGPFDGKAWNVLPNLETLPSSLTKDQAAVLAQDIGTIKIRPLSSVKYTMDEVTIIRALPKNYKIMGWIFQTGYGTTLDAVGDAALKAMAMGGNGIILANRALEYSPSSYTVGIGTTGVGSSLGSGTDNAKDNGFTAGGALGFAYSKGKKNASEGLAWAVISY